MIPELSIKRLPTLQGPLGNWCDSTLGVDRQVYVSHQYRHSYGKCYMGRCLQTPDTEDKQEVYDIDRYGRTVGVVYIDGTNVNQEILRAGYTWQYRRYCKAAFCSDWIKLEEVATAAKMELWADPKAILPWEWRRVKSN